jgi:hypothetical protein
MATVKEQKMIFAGAALVMFTGYLWAVVSCPPPRPDEAWLLFTMGVAETLLPAFFLLGIARRLPE